MIRLTGLLLLAAAALPAATAEKPGPQRAAMVAVGQNFDGRIRNVSAADPMDLLSPTQAVYLAGYGAVFTTRVDLITTPTINPFRLTMTRQDVERIRARKLEHLPLLKEQMRAMLREAAASLEKVPATEQVVVAVTVFCYQWEDTNGIPAQIVMQAPKQKLLNAATAESAIQTQEY